MKRLCLALTLGLVALPTVAQDNDVTGKIAVELNAAETQGDSCVLTFMITNSTSVEAAKIVYETVLFDATGQVNRLTLFDFGTVPPARPRVRQFSVPQLSCENLSRVLFNGAHSCEGEGLDETVCDAGFVPSSRVKIEVLG